MSNITEKSPINASREGLVRTLSLMNRERHTIQIIERAHSELHFQAPSQEQVAHFKELVGTRRRTAKMIVAQPSVDKILDLRSRELPTGILGLENRKLANKVELRLLAGNHSGGRHEQEYSKTARNFAKLVALYYCEKGQKPSRITPALGALLPYVAAHLSTETELALEARFALPHRNLRSHSVFEMEDKLDMLRSHPDEIVRSNAKVILHAALINKNLNFVDALAVGAQAAYETVSNHPDQIVSDNARLIICVALSRGKLEYVGKIASGTQREYERLVNNGHPIISENARSIITAAIKLGSPKMARNLSHKTYRKYRELLKHKSPIVRENARTITLGGLRRGNLNSIDSLASGAQKVFDKLTNHPDSIVRDNARNILCTSLKSGKLELADELATGAQRAYLKVSNNKSMIVRRNARNIVCSALTWGSFDVIAGLARDAGVAYRVMKQMGTKNPRTLVSQAIRSNHLPELMIARA